MYISDEAQFTPKNVQTPEERVNLVFAVKIKLDNTDHRLKPGMPADAEILLNSEVTPVTKASSPALPQITVAPTSTPTPITVKPTRPTVTPTPTATEPAPSVQAKVIAWGLNVRSGPGIDYPIIATLAKGDKVPVIEVDPDTGWLQVQLLSGEKSGWISGSPTYVD